MAFEYDGNVNETYHVKLKKAMLEPAIEWWETWRTWNYSYFANKSVGASWSSCSPQISPLKKKKRFLKAWLVTLSKNDVLIVSFDIPIILVSLIFPALESTDDHADVPPSTMALTPELAPAMLELTMLTPACRGWFWCRLWVQRCGSDPPCSAGENHDRVRRFLVLLLLFPRKKAAKKKKTWFFEKLCDHKTGDTFITPWSNAHKWHPNVLKMCIFPKHQRSPRQSPKLKEIPTSDPSDSRRKLRLPAGYPNWSTFT